MSENGELFRQLVERAPDVIYLYRLRSTLGFAYVNPAIVQVLGYTADEFYADPEIFRKLLHPDDRPLIETLAQGPSTLILRWQNKAGDWRWLEHHFAPIFDTAGDLVAVEGIARDVTEQALRDASQKNQVAELEQFRQIVRLAAHQLNNTLTEAVGLLDIARHRNNLLPPVTLLIDQALASLTTATQQVAKLQEEIRPKQ